MIFTAFYQGFAGTFALSCALHTPMSTVWVLGVIWAATFLGIDRLVLMIGSGRRGWLALLPRLVLTVLLGIVMAEVMTLRIFAPEVTQELAITQQTALTHQIRSINHTYTAKVSADEQGIATWQAKENTLKQTITRDNFLYNCERFETDCSQTGVAGNGAFAHRDSSEAVNAQASLAALEPLANQQIAADKADITLEGRIQSAALSEARSAVRNGAGLLARIEALGQLEHDHPDARWAAYLLSAVFMALDFAPALLRLSLLISGRLVSDQLNEDDQQVELTTGIAVRTAAEVERSRIDDQAFADMDVNRVLIDLDRQRRIDEAMAWGSSSGSRARQSPGSRPRSAALVAAPSLKEFAAKARPHEMQPVPLAPALRRGALVGTALIAATSAVIAPLQLIGHVALAGSGIVYGALFAVLALAIYSRGFRTAPDWAHRAAFATLLTGIALPVLVALLNA